MLEGYLQKINQYLKTDSQSINLSLDYSDSLRLQEQWKRSAEYVEILKKNGSKIQLLIQQNDRLRKENSLQLRTIEVHLSKVCDDIEKQIEMKYMISNLEGEVEILNSRIFYLQKELSNRSIQYQYSIDKKQYKKIIERLQNSKIQNQILRNENKKYSEQDYVKQKNFRYLEQHFKRTIKQMNDTIQSLSKELQLQIQRSLLVQKLEGQNYLLLTQNKKLNLHLQNKILQYDNIIQNLVKELQRKRVDKELIEQKYNEISQTIEMVEGMRKEYKMKKKQIEWKEERQGLWNMGLLMNDKNKNGDQEKIVSKGSVQSNKKEKNAGISKQTVKKNFQKSKINQLKRQDVCSPQSDLRKKNCI